MNIFFTVLITILNIAIAIGAFKEGEIFIGILFILIALWTFTCVQMEIEEERHAKNNY